MLTLSQKEKIAHAVIAVLVQRFGTFPTRATTTRNAPFHRAFLQAFGEKLETYATDVPFLISLSSWLHGLNTTLGQSFFERTAHVLCYGEKRTFPQPQVTSRQLEIIDQILADLKNGRLPPNVAREDALLRAAAGEGSLVTASKFTTDVLVEDVEHKTLTAIELKSVRPNSGEMRGEKRKILTAKAAWFVEHPDWEIHYFMGFPFDPLCETPTGADKARFLNALLVEGHKFLASEEVLLASELWDYLSGAPHTMEQILEIINTIATPQFMEHFQFVRFGKNRRTAPQRYRAILQEWFLHREIYFWEQEQCTDDPVYRRLLDNTLFSAKGQYNAERYTALRERLDAHG